MLTAAGSGLAAVVVILLLAPSSLAGPAIHSVVLSAPYSGTKSGISQSVSLGGCGTTAFSIAPFFHGRAGFGGFSAWSKAPTCSNPLGSSGDTSVSLLSEVPIPLSTHSSAVVAVLNVAATGSSHVRAGSCAISSPSYGYCYQYASASLYGYAYVEDSTSGNIWWSSTYWPGVSNFSYAEKFCSAGNCSSYRVPGGSFSGSSTFALTINVTGAFVSHHHYWLVVSFYGSTYASEFTYGASLTGGRTSASLDVASGSNGISLASITIV